MKERNTGQQRRKRGGLLWAGLLALAVLLNLLARCCPGFAEGYAAQIYPLIVGTVGRMCSLVPFSVSELLLYGAAVGIAVSTVLMAAGKIGLKPAASFAGKAAVLLFLLFTLNCGINYQRLTFSEKAGFSSAEASKEELIVLCEQLVRELNEAAPETDRDEQGYFLLTTDLEGEAIRAMQALGQDYPDLAGYYPRAKEAAGSFLLSWQQLQGVYSPFTVEANYNGDMPDCDKPSTVCHELSHLKGFMREDEANFIACLACLSSDNAAFRYSGAMLAYIYCGNALYGQDPQSLMRIREELCGQAVKDLQAHNAYWTSYEGTVSKVSDRVNDTYLKANSQADGTESYGRVVDLLLAWNRERGDEEWN